MLFEQFPDCDASTRSRSNAARYKTTHFAEEFLKQFAKLDNFVDFRRWQRRAGMQFGPKSRYGDPSREFSQQLISIKPHAQSINRQKSTFLANSSSQSNSANRHSRLPAASACGAATGSAPIAAGTPCDASGTLSHNGPHGPRRTGRSLITVVRAAAQRPSSYATASTPVAQRSSAAMAEPAQQDDPLSQIYVI